MWRHDKIRHTGIIFDISTVVCVCSFTGTTTTHYDYEKKRFIAFNCRQNKLNEEIFVVSFEIRFTGYKPECNFWWVQISVDPHFLLEISRKLTILMFVRTNIINVYVFSTVTIKIHIFYAFLKEKNKFHFFLQILY